jgi:hypothetical protein
VEGEDLPVELGERRTPTHGARTIAAPIPAFNARRATIALAVAFAASTAAAAEVPLPGGGHVDAGGQVDGLAVVDTGGGKRQRPEALGTLRVDVAPAARWLRAHLDLRGMLGGPYEGGPGVGVFDFDREFQNYSPSLEVREGWVEARARRAELRVGVQQFAWGRLDGVPPTDVVNPRDYHDPIVWDAEDRKIGVPAVRVKTYLPDVRALDLHGPRLTLAWLPIGVPARLPELEERWFPTATLVHSPLPLPPTLHGVPLPVRDVALRYSTANDPPPRTFDGGGIAARLAGRVARVDWDLYHYTGPTTAPDLVLDTVLRNAAAPPRARFVADVALTQTRDTVHMTGADLAVPVGDWTLRFETAGTLGQPELRDVRDVVSPAVLAQLPIRRILGQIGRTGQARVALPPLFADVDMVQWGIGADTVWNGFQPILQVSQAIAPGAPTLLIADPETRVVAVLRKRFWDERLEFDGRAYMAVDKADWFVMPRLGWRIRDDVRVRVGYLAIGGPRRSLVGQYGRNDEVLFDARWTF